MSSIRRFHIANRSGPLAGLAGIVVAVLLVLTVGPGASTGVAGASVLGPSTINICKTSNVIKSFSFSVNSATPVSVMANTCLSLTVENGRNTVTELSDPATTLTGIAVSPQLDTVSSSVPNRTVTVNIPANAAATVTFTNVGTGHLTVCKNASDAAVPPGPWQFTVTNAATGAVVGTESALVGACSTPLPVPGGTYTVTEKFAAPDYVDAVTVNPPGAVAPGTPNPNLASGSVTVTVANGATTTATFTNDTDGHLTVCKNASDPAVPPGPWQFTVTNAATGAVVGTESALVGACSTPLQVPGGTYTVTEKFSSPDVVDSITVSPPSDLVPGTPNPNLATGSVTVTVANGATTTATFTNDTNGHLTVCKNASDALVPPGPWQFTVTNAATGAVVGTESALVGACSTPLQVPGGTYTVTEKFSSPDVVDSITVDPPSDLAPGTPNPNLATGSVTVTVANGATTTATFTNDTQTGKLTVCKNASDALVPPGPWQFTVTNAATGAVVGTESALVGACSTPLPVPGGTYTVTEKFSSPDVVDSITVNPPGALAPGTPNPNLATGSVTVTVANGATTTATFTNDTDGFLTVCKNASDALVPPGPWQFTVTNAATGAVVGTESALVGACSTPLQVPSGTYTVTEKFSSPDVVDSITVDPPSDLAPGTPNPNLATGSVTVTVQGVAVTTATFTNDTQTGKLIVCKSASGTSVPPGPWQFTITNAATGAVVGTESALVGACSTPLPVPGGTYTVTEKFSSPDVVDSITVNPPGALAPGTPNPNLATGSVTVTVANGATTTVTVTNSTHNLGWVEVCKKAGDTSVGSTSFNFSVNGGPSFPVHAGMCSQPIQVSSGTATVQEIQSNPNYYLATVSTQGVTDPAGSRLLSANTQSGLADVSVPAGTVDNETVVTFTNSTRMSQFKICTAQTSLGAALAGDSFPYSWSYSLNGSTYSGSVNLIVPIFGATCSGLIPGNGPIPVIDASGAPVRVTVTAGAPPGIVSVDLAGFLYQGSGSVVTTPKTPGPFPQTLTFNVGGGVNVATFTNGATH